jgi:hypothetical protein
MRLKPLLFVIALAVVAVSSTAAQAANAPLTSAAYLTDVNSVCSIAHRQQAVVKKSTSPADFGRFIREMVFTERGKLSALGHLSPPAALSSLHAAVLANLRAQIALGDALPADLGAKVMTQRAITAGTKLDALATAQVALWKKIGAATCAGTGGN